MTTTKANKDLNQLLAYDLLAMMGHELKSPLSTIKLYIQLAMSMAKKSENHLAAGVLLKADNQIIAMSSIIDNILDMSLIDSGQKTLRSEAFDMGELIQEVICGSSQESITHIIQPVFEGAQLVYGDRSKIRQVLGNLLSNAVKYSPERSSIIIASQYIDRQIQVSVRDNGPGISFADQESLFTRYYRAVCEEIRDKPGYGLGLYIVQEIVRQHGGKVWVESVEGTGSVFFFCLPVFQPL